MDKILKIAFILLFPTFIFAETWDENVISAQRFENNLTNDTGGMTWTFSGTGAAPFSDTIYKNGAYSSGRWETSGSRYYGNVTILPKTIELYLYLPTGHANVNRYAFSNNSVSMQCEYGGCRVLDRAEGKWTYFATINDNTWYHIEITNSGSHLIYRVNGTVIDEFDCTSNLGTGTLYVGNFTIAEDLPLDGYIDDFILSSDVRTSFPTDPLPTQTITPTVTQTVTQTVTETVTETATQTVTETVTQTVTPTVTETATPTITPTVMSVIKPQIHSDENNGGFLQRFRMRFNHNILEKSEFYTYSGRRKKCA